MKRNRFYHHALVLLSVLLSSATIFTSCKEDIDESNLYTFTGETIEDYWALNFSLSRSRPP